jgi:dihydrolipoamide dehydrogenase
MKDTGEMDLVVIGGGPGGYVAAIRAAQLGLKVACVEKEAVLGGTCLRVGCIPSKVLLESSEKYREVTGHLGQHGIRVSGVELDLAALMKRKEAVVQMLTQGIDGLFRRHKIARHVGHGRLNGSGSVLVEHQGQKTELKARHVILATGSRSASISGVECDGDRIGTSTEALAYPAVPGHLVVIGAGYIGLELGCVWLRLGAKVTVLEFLDRILPGMDEEIAADAQKIFARQGLQFRLGVRVTGIRREGDGCVVESEGADSIQCDRVLVAVGRRPHTEGLGLETAGIQVNEKGRIPVDERFATCAEGVYAIGDVIGGAMLAHKAEEEGIAPVGTARAICGGWSRSRRSRSSRSAIPTSGCSPARSKSPAAAEVGKAPRTYGDYREMLKEHDLDIVLIGSPDHWHALQAIAAIEAGADVYCRSRSASTCSKGEAILAAARKHGAWCRSAPSARARRT